MMLERPVAFLAFAVAMAATPGPSNTLLAATGAAVGIRRGLPCLLGVGLGMGSMMFVVTLGLGTAILEHPLLLATMKWCGAALLCWLAWRVATARQETAPTTRPVGPVEAAVLQWVNPKAWLACASATATFLDPRAGSAVVQSMTLALLFVAACLPSCFPWLASGAALRRVLRSPRAHRAFHLAMAVLLATSAALALL